MGIKFLGSTTAGAKPTTAQVGERELAFNLVDGAIYTNDGTAIVRLAYDQAGTIYMPSSTYNAGTIVTYGGKAYIHTSGAPVTGVFDPAKWTAINLEIGGKAFDATITYDIGDVVSDGGKIYISKVGNNIGNIPAGAITSWQDTATSLIYVSTFAPSGATEYPATPTANTYYRIAGLATPYTFTSGSLNGQTAANGDELIYDGATWTVRPGPSIPAEHGGILWTSANSYKQGDLVSFNHDIYVAKADNSGNQPDTSNVEWEKYGGHPEIGGKSWVTLTDYTIGDVIVDGGVAYVCKADHTSSAAFVTDALSWSDAFIIANVDPGTY